MPSCEPCACDDPAKVETVRVTAGVTTAAVTVSVAVPVIVPEVAVIVDVPTATALARPPVVIVANVGADDVQVTVDVRSLVELSE